MKKDTYIGMINWIKNRPEVSKAIFWANRIFTTFVYVSFFVMLFYLLFERGIEKAVWLVAGTCVPFVLVSFFRNIIDRERPYQKFGVEPVIPRNKKGKSYPSRHVFSVFIIGVAGVFFFGYIGWIIIAIGTVIAFLRVVGGVHYVSDIICGALFGLLFGYVSFYLV